MATRTSLNNTATLPHVVPQPGQPLYESVKKTLVDAIDAGHFTDRQRLPSTKELSRQMSVSLVTAHRALRELVGAGILERTQGRGTFVVEHGKRASRKIRLALLLHREASLADFYHSRLLEGMRQACNEQGVELTISHFDAPLPRQLDGYLLINPLREELEAAVAAADSKARKLVVGARWQVPGVHSMDVDNKTLARRAVEHLDGLRHRRIGYLGNEPRLSNSRDRWQGFKAAMAALDLRIDTRHVIHAADWRLTPSEKMHLNRLLSAPDRPTALFAAGYSFALDVYEACATLGINVPGDLSVVGVDNPPSAAHVSPPLTTVQQPLVEMGHAAVISITESIRDPKRDLEDQILHPDLIIRRSSAPVRSSGDPHLSTESS